MNSSLESEGTPEAPKLSRISTIALFGYITSRVTGGGEQPSESGIWVTLQK